jgi:hypothetical protein
MGRESGCRSFVCSSGTMFNRTVRAAKSPFSVRAERPDGSCSRPACGRFSSHFEESRRMPLPSFRHASTADIWTLRRCCVLSGLLQSGQGSRKMSRHTVSDIAMRHTHCIEDHSSTLWQRRSVTMTCRYRRYVCMRVRTSRRESIWRFRRAVAHQRTPDYVFLHLCTRRVWWLN